MILLVVDTQKGCFDERLYAFETVRDNIKRLITVARENHVEVIYVQHDAGPRSGLSVGDKGFEIADQVSPEKGEKIFITYVNKYEVNRIKAIVKAADDEFKAGN